MDASYYQLTCECGREIRTTALLSTCQHCGRLIRIEWHTKAEFRAQLWTRPTPREDPVERSERLKIMRFKKQVRKEIA